MNTDTILEDIKTRGAQNAAAIQSHHDHSAGQRGATGRNKRKNGLQGLTGPKRKKISPHQIPMLPNTKHHGKPIKADGTDGYKRDRITGVITRCVQI